MDKIFWNRDFLDERRQYVFFYQNRFESVPFRRPLSINNKIDTPNVDRTDTIRLINEKQDMWLVKHKGRLSN